MGLMVVTYHNDETGKQVSLCGGCANGEKKQARLDAGFSSVVEMLHEGACEWCLQGVDLRVDYAKRLVGIALEMRTIEMCLELEASRKGPASREALARSRLHVAIEQVVKAREAINLL